MHNMIKEIKFVTDANLAFLTKKLKTHKVYLEYIRSTLQEQREQTAYMPRIDTSLEYVEKLLEEVK
tara:strand:- start:657 stop:854 length:198 start_codon:yes stop_codon:yes gene_type:complete